MNLNINVVERCIDFPKGMIAEEIRHTTQACSHLSTLVEYVIHDWPSPEAKVKEEVQLYWQFRDNMLVSDGIVMKSRIAIPTSLQQRRLEQLHINYMGIERAKLLAKESMYLVNINADIKTAT